MSGFVVRETLSASIAPTDLAARSERVARYKARLDDFRRQVRVRFEQLATGSQITGLQSQLYDSFLIEVLESTLQAVDRARRTFFETETALIAVGGTGRGDLCPHSDLDLLFISPPREVEAFENFTSQVIRDLWDSGLQLGVSVRTIPDALRWSKSDPKFATSLVDARTLWGNENLCQQLISRFQRVLRSSPRRFIAEAVEERNKERAEQSTTTQQLEPDVKRSLGGLRDLHLIRWIGFATRGVSNIESLRLQGALSQDEARQLIHAQDFLLRLRVDLHLSAGREQDVLTRDEQLRISRSRGIAGASGQAPVERFMQEYFQHSSAVASIARRFVASTRRPSWAEQLLKYLLAYRIDDVYYVGMESVDVAQRHRHAVCSTIEGVLKLFLTAVRYRVQVAPHLIDFIKSVHLQPPAHLSAEASQTFLALLNCPGKLGLALRDLHETGVLEAVLPCWKRIRGLIQFNQYHHFTVDEHTLRAIEAAESFLEDTGSVGQAYREIHHKELLHLALLLHDAGKGFVEDHSEVGRRLANDIGIRLGLPDHQRESVMLLVHRHLHMADLALRRDIGDQALLLKFSHEVGSPDALRMLFVLTAADISAVGPGVWNDWKAQLTTTLYDRTMLWLSGMSHLFDEATRLRKIEQEVSEILITTGITANDADQLQAVKRLLQQCPTHYLLETPSERIAADFVIIQNRRDDEISVEAQYEPASQTVEYRVILHEQLSSGCFHKLAGALSAKRLEILSAAICTTQDGVIIDACRVRDADHVGEIPQFRIEEVSNAIRRVLRGETDVESLLRSRGRFAVKADPGPVSDLPLRVVIDNESSDRYTIVDVFAHDRPGLLYAITRTLFELELSVVQAKIATHFDQVLDVFFVTDAIGKKIHDGQRLTAIREFLLSRLTAFEDTAKSESSG